jgi:branched-chain amino acid transport system ATP-binding protein
MLSIKGMEVRYGGITAVKGLSIDVKERETVALIGANGAGKTTTLRAVSGLIRPVAGSCFFEGREITGMATDAIVSLGIIHSPEGRQVFSRMTVEENLMLGAYLQKDRARIHRNRDWALTLFPILGQRRKQQAGTLSGGEQQMLAISRALMADPKLLLLDEPSMGLSPLLTQQVFDVLTELKSQGLTILLVEQNAFEALKISDRAYVIETGAAAMEGKSGDLLEDPQVIDAYLGGNY